MDRSQTTSYLTPERGGRIPPGGRDRTIRKWARGGQLKGRKLPGGQWRFTPAGSRRRRCAGRPVSHDLNQDAALRKAIRDDPEGWEGFWRRLTSGLDDTERKLEKPPRNEATE